MTADELVEAFLSKLVECEWALKQAYTGASRAGAGAPLTLFGADPKQRISRGTIGGLGEFRMHGAGCRFELDSGAIVDFDWDSDGRIVFNAWRVLVFARSIGIDTSSETSLLEALHARGLTETETGWFTSA